MDLPLTIGLLLTSTSIFFWARWEADRPPEQTGPRLLPHTTIMMIAAVFAVALLAHLATLAGFETGRR